MPALCRDCMTTFPAGTRCPACRSPRVLAHPALFDLTIAHLDCDAFYASVEKRDHPEWRDLPVIVGGGQRGVVSTCCYIARIHGVRSAMPMFQALKLCPQAVVVRPRMAVYAQVSREIRAMMETLTPAIEPLSLDEAFLDLSGTARLHGAPPAVLMARLVARMESELGIGASVGLAGNKFLAKIASDLDKPRGFSVIGPDEAQDFLAPRSVRILWGVGESGQAALAAAGIRTVSDLRRWDRADLAARFGRMGDRLWHLARGIDTRRVQRDAAPRSISRETTLSQDIADPGLIEGHLWRLAEQTADRAKAQGLAGRTVTVKLKCRDFTLISRRQALADPTQSADRLFRTAWDLFRPEAARAPFRLLGVGLSDLTPADQADRMADLLDPAAARRLAAERATDAIRARFGAEAIIRGRALR